MVTPETLNKHDVRSDCCNGRVTVLLKQFTSVYGDKIVWQCLTCGNAYVIGNKE